MDDIGRDTVESREAGIVRLDRDVVWVFAPVFFQTPWSTLHLTSLDICSG
ncbi:hypothetical protein PX554_19445 [Sphingomonas sp. H39-1-10]|nr:hypothetical protein [Sphingomonas pollutisoli]MDF0490305.1 hypothetical protein [Sphingomonas pollutisoli]